MAIHFATESDLDGWNDLVLANPDGGNIFQGYEFGMQKKRGGWTPRFLTTDSLAILALEKSIPGLGKLWYLPNGPGVSSVRQLDDLVPDVRQLATDNGVFAVKIEPELPKTDETLASLMKLRLVRVAPIQPNVSTVLLDIRDDLDTVMQRLGQKARHAIRRAERDGVVVRQVASDDANCQLMYHLLAETAAGSFAIRAYDYYRSFWQRYATAGLGQLFFAYAGDQVVAAAYALCFGTKSTYKDGASVRQRPVYGASHLLQWRVIEWAKARGAQVHDLCGTPPSDQIDNPDHPHHGIGRFKTSFYREVTDYIGAYDLVIRPTAYRIWRRLGERLVRRWHRIRYHEEWY